jgi:ubiquinone/menaquinone biosynthesis C-methylase UbiE
MIDFPVLPSGEKPVWDGECFQLGGRSVRVLAYSSNFAGWDDDLTVLHEVEAGDGQHPIDIASRSTAIDALRSYGFPIHGAVLEIGCSSGFLLHDLRQAFPHAEIVGADIVVKPLERLGESLPGVQLVQMDVLQCPLRGQQFDAVVALNVLEHIEEDGAALEKMARLLKPGGILVLEVPQGPNLYDCFDAYLRHFRRYSKKDLLAKIAASGLQLQKIAFLGFVPYLSFWVVKNLNRLRFGLRGEKSPRIEELVREQIKITAKSKILEFAFSIEKALVRKISFPVGIRCTVVARQNVSNDRSGSGKLDRGISDGSALCGDDSAADERSREHETTPP